MVEGKRRFLILCEYVIAFLCIIISLYLAVVSYKYYFLSGEPNTVWKKDSVMGLITEVSVLCCLLFVICVVASKRKQKAADIIFGILLAVDIVFMIWWIFNAMSTAFSDSYCIYSIAKQIISGDYSAIVPRDSYMSLWPFQAGLLLYFEIVLRVVGDYNVFPLELLNVIFIAITMIFAYKTVKRFTNNEKVLIAFSILQASCLPYVMYVNFAYGEIPSIMGIVLSYYCFSRYLEGNSYRFALSGLGALLFALTVRNNTIIYCIAIILVLLVLLLSDYKKRYIALLLGIVLCMLIARLLPQKIYEWRAEDSMGTGVPASCYVAMGIQESDGYRQVGIMGIIILHTLNLITMKS